MVLEGGASQATHASSCDVLTSAASCPWLPRLQGLPKHLAAIEEISEYAAKEYSLERLLDKMQADWSECMH
jgi:hypothetical protein